MNLLSYQTFVLAPFIILKIGEYTFGAYKKDLQPDSLGIMYKVTYPNYMLSINIVKVNGMVNTYTIQMIYPISKGSDPNLMDKVFSSISNSREVYISYGDWSSPSFIYKEEKAILTSVKQNVNFLNSLIQYTLTCTSDALSLKSNVYDFPARIAKPSDVIIELLLDLQYGLKDIFKGMQDINKVRQSGIIASDDMEVPIPLKKQTNIIDYINYLTSCMIPQNLPQKESSSLKKSFIGISGAIKNIIIPVSNLILNITESPAVYYMTIIDDVQNEFNGPYFTVKKMLKQEVSIPSPDTYEIDVGFPGNNFVTDFRISSDDTWSILYNFSKEINQQTLIYRINNDGEMETIDSSNLLSLNALREETPTSKTWWTSMTQFPILAEITLKGLLRPTILMSYINVNVYFYGVKHVSSGLYIITKLQDLVSSNGYSTTLSLTRVGNT